MGTSTNRLAARNLRAIIFFKLIADKTAYVYSSTVCFICSDLQELTENRVKLFMVSEAEHLDILESLDGF